MTSIAAFFRKTPVNRLKDYFTQYSSLPPIDWSKPEPEVIEPLIKAVDAMGDAERQRVVLDAARVAALATEAGQTALRSVVLDRAAFNALEGFNNRSLWVFLRENERFCMAEEVLYNDERRRGRSWSGFEIEKECSVRKDVASLAAFTAAIRERFDTPNAHVDIFDRHRVLLDDLECDLVQVAIYREGAAEDVLGFDDSSRIARRVVRPVFEAAMTYEPATGVVEVVAGSRKDRVDLTRLMAKHLLGIDFEEKFVPLREYDLSVLLKPYSFPTDPEDGIESVTVRELRLLDSAEPGERIELLSPKDARRTIWDMARHRVGLGADEGAPAFPSEFSGETPDWAISRAVINVRFRPAAGGGRGKSLTLTVTMPHGCDLKDMTPHERLIGEKYLRHWNILKEEADARRSAE
jgi:hypothetical protein